MKNKKDKDYYRRIESGWCYKRKNKPQLVMELLTIDKGNECFTMSFFEAIKLHNSLEETIRRRGFWDDAEKKEKEERDKKLNELREKVKNLKEKVMKYRKNRDFNLANYFQGKLEVYKLLLKNKIIL